MSETRRFVVVFIIDGLGLGGAERLMVPILKYLDRNIFEPRVCVLQDKDGNPMAEDLFVLGVPVDLLPIHYLRDITAIPRIYAYLRRVKADLVHTQLEFSNILGNFAAKLLRLPTVSTIHTMPRQDMGRKMKLHQTLEMMSLRFFCDKVISVSEEARLFHLKIGQFLPHKIQTIYNGIDFSNFSELDIVSEAASVRNELALPVEAKLLTTVAVLRELKGIQFMLRALPAVLDKYSNVYYLIVGSGAYREALERETDNLGIKSHVIFLGKRSDIPRLLAATDIFILPTLTEALPTVLAEAMAAHLPIIACKVGGVPEMVMDEVNGILIPPEDPPALSNACVSLLSDLDRGKTMGEAGWRFASQKFNIQMQVEQLKNLYVGLIETYEQ